MIFNSSFLVPICCVSGVCGEGGGGGKCIPGENGQPDRCECRPGLTGPLCDKGRCFFLLLLCSVIVKEIFQKDISFENNTCKILSIDYIFLAA